MTCQMSVMASKSVIGIGEAELGLILLRGTFPQIKRFGKKNIGAPYRTLNF